MNTTNKNKMVNGWNLSLFKHYGENLTYGTGAASCKFIARFKYTTRDRAGFQKFLVANFTPTEYFTQLMNSTPVGVLKTKGYISTTVKGMLKRRGYSVDQAGLEKMKADDRAVWEAAAKNPVIKVFAA